MSRFGGLWLLIIYLKLFMLTRGLIPCFFLCKDSLINLRPAGWFNFVFNTKKQAELN
jgi:hypothetical protein